MDGNLFITEIELTVITTISLLIVRELVLFGEKSRTNNFLIAYFSVLAFVYGSTGIYFLLIYWGLITVSLEVFRLIVLTPKFFVMLGFWWHLVQNKRKL